MSSSTTCNSELRTSNFFLLTIDVEDWFQVENFKPCIPFSSWPTYELRIERNVHRILDLLDTIKPMPQPQTPNSELRTPNSPHLDPRILESSNPSFSLRTSNLELRTSNSKISPSTTSNFELRTSNFPSAPCPSTFFTLGWIAKRLPHLVREIHARGHEVASHGCNHHLCCHMTAETLKKDLTDSKNLLEDIIGAPVNGYRAPSFSISDTVLNIIQDAGFIYDSSYNSFGYHGRYGKISLNGGPKHGIAHRLADNFFELPVSNFSLQIPGTSILKRLSSSTSNLRHFELRTSNSPPDICHLTSGFWHLTPVLPLGGGAYFRLLPFFIFKQGVKSVLKKTGAFIFYMHPWELDPEQPRPAGASKTARLKHYTNINKNHSKLKAMLQAFRHCRFTTCTDYLNLQRK